MKNEIGFSILLALGAVALSACGSDNDLGGTGASSQGGHDGAGGSVTSNGGAGGSTLSNGGAGGSSSSANGGAGGSGGATLVTYPRLVVASAAGVAIWDNADTITSDVAPSAVLSGVGEGLGLVLAGDTLLVTSSDASTGLYRFDGAPTLANGASPSSSMAASAFGGAFPPFHTQLQLDAAGDLWVQSAEDLGSIQLVKNAKTATSVRASFTHMWQQIEGMVFDEAGGKLLGGQISGAGILAWNGAATASGTSMGGDYQLDAAAAFHMTIAGGRLYTSSYGPADLRIWNAIGGVDATTPPDATLTGLCNMAGVGNELRYSTVQGDVLVVVHNEINGSAQLERVCLYKHASAMNATRPADGIATDASLKPGGDDKAWLTSDGHLFVADSEGVAIFSNATTAPVFVTKLLTGIDTPHDILVLE